MQRHCEKTELFSGSEGMKALRIQIPREDKQKILLNNLLVRQVL